VIIAPILRSASAAPLSSAISHRTVPRPMSYSCSFCGAQRLNPVPCSSSTEPLLGRLLGVPEKQSCLIHQASARPCRSAPHRPFIKCLRIPSTPFLLLAPFFSKCVSLYFSVRPFSVARKPMPLRCRRVFQLLDEAFSDDHGRPLATNSRVPPASCALNLAHPRGAASPRHQAGAPSPAPTPFRPLERFFLAISSPLLFVF